MRSESITPREMTYGLEMTKNILLAAIGVLVMLALGFVAGRWSCSDSPELKTKAAALDHYCRVSHDQLASTVKDLTDPSVTGDIRGAAILAADDNLSMPDLYHLRPCFAEADVAKIPSHSFACTKAFKNDDNCRIETLKKALALFPEEYGGP